MKKKPNPLVYVFLVLGAILIIFPMYLTVITAFKPTEELTKSIFAFPSSLYLGNFEEVITKSGFVNSVINTVFVTIITNICTIFC